jgi:spore germination protein
MTKVQRAVLFLFVSGLVYALAPSHASSLMSKTKEAVLLAPQSTQAAALVATPVVHADEPTVVPEVPKSIPKPQTEEILPPPLSQTPAQQQTLSSSTPLPSSSPSPAPSPTPVPAVTPQPQPTAAPRGSVVAWMQGQDWSEAVESVRKNAAHIREVAPAWYIANGDGSISARRGVPVNDPALIGIAREHGIMVRPLIMSVPGAGASPQALIALLQDKTLRQKQIESLAKLAVDMGYEGLDLDYESIPPRNLPDLATYVEELANALHANGKTLAVSIETHPNEVVLPAWRRIGAAADNVRLMAYGKKSATRAPITDPAWMRERVAHALRAIPKEKLTVGLPLYCLRWEGQTISSGSWARLHTEDKNKVYCENAASVKEKVDIARELGASTIAFWRLGGEDPAIWEKIKP